MDGPASKEALNACNEAGRQCIERGDLQGAHDAFAKGLDLLRENPDPKREAVFLNNLAHVFVSMNRHGEALEYFQKAGRLCESVGDRTGLAWQLANAGSVYRDRGENDAALENYSRALGIFKEEDQQNGIADQYSNIGYIHAMRGEPEVALEWFEKARALYDSLGQARKAVLAKKNIDILTDSGNR